jgi:hypothetical protein
MLGVMTHLITNRLRVQLGPPGEAALKWEPVSGPGDSGSK